MTTALCPLVAFVAVASACLEVGKETPGRISTDRKSTWFPTRAVLICARVFLDTLSSEKTKEGPSHTKATEEYCGHRFLVITKSQLSTI
ncbi:unnamed protein product [Lasius platythorax]|uniref:Secreted protein n=1 Tax=Lasius platythorax TaxID=488582 RepID=A0AAV2N6B4_9HYME